MNEKIPPGQPGVVPRWTSSAKNGVGTALSAQSPLWFTLSHGIINEVYYPDVDQANIRDLGFLVSAGSDFFSEEKRAADVKFAPLSEGVPGYRLINTCREKRYRITKTVVTDPERPVLLQKVQFEPLQGELHAYNLYALLAPHLNNHGADNNGWVGNYKGVPLLYASCSDGLFLAMGCSIPFKGMSCGYVGTSDGWQDISQHKRMTWFYSHAPAGNIALTAQIDLIGCDGKFVLALGFGHSAEEAGQHVRAALLKDFDQTAQTYIQQWQAFQHDCRDLSKVGKANSNLYRISTAVLKMHDTIRYSGGIIASLSIPWGNIKGDHDLGGYHLVWPRDAVEAAGGLLAAGDANSARHTVLYLMATQDDDGHWPQNMWLDGSPYWSGLQMDETALFIVLADQLRRSKQLASLDVWPTVCKAAAFIASHGPVTQEDRWEENSGYSPFTLATEVVGLLAAAEFADEAGESSIAAYLRQIADTWNDNIERWTYVTNTDLAQQVGVDGYYVRIAPPDVLTKGNAANCTLTLKNLPPDQADFSAADIVSPDALALVRFGLRPADDPKIINTIKVIDAVLKTETNTGPLWHRYNHDGYGEHADGYGFNGTGIGRGWPLLTGERAHYELAAGNKAYAQQLLAVMTAQASVEGGLISEQVWDTDDIPKQNLFNGHPSHSARPLVWAHAEYIKLLRSLKDGKVFDMPDYAVQRYQKVKITSPLATWRFKHKCSSIPRGKCLRVEVLAAAQVHWSGDNWQTSQTISTTDSGLCIYFADLDTDKLTTNSTISFTFYWEAAQCWEGTNFEVGVE